MKRISLKLFSLIACILLFIGCTIGEGEAEEGPVTRLITSLAHPNGMDTVPDKFEQAVTIIKKYEGMHLPKHWPLVGYGHKILPGEKFSRKKTLSVEEAEKLLRKDLYKNCAAFRSFGADSLLLGVLAYNIGIGNVMRSSVTESLRNGDRDIRDKFLSHCRYKGKVMTQIKRRRKEEFDTLFEKLDTVNKKSTSGNKMALAFVTN